MYCRIKFTSELWNYLAKILIEELNDAPGVTKRCLVSHCHDKSYDIKILAPPCELDDKELKKFQICMNNFYKHYEQILTPVILNEMKIFAAKFNRVKIFKSVIENCLKVKSPSQELDPNCRLVFCLLDDLDDSLSNLRCLNLAHYYARQSERNQERCQCHILQLSNFKHGETFGKFFPQEESYSANQIQQHEIEIKEVIYKQFPLLTKNKRSSLQEIINPEECEKNVCETSADWHAFKTAFVALNESIKFLAMVNKFKDEFDSGILDCLIVCSNLNQVKALQINLFQIIFNHGKNPLCAINHVVFNRGSSTDVTFGQFMNERFRFNQENYESRSLAFAESTTDDEILKMTISTVSLQMHECSIKTAFKGHNTGTAKASFILYNYARLFMLIQEFNTRVEIGKYPPLPSIDEINFDLLREVAEWNLVREGLWFLHNNLHSLTQPHIMVAYLHKLCSLTSSFYSKHHILDDNRFNHLLPVMFARLFLIKAVLSAMGKLFYALNVNPLHKM